MANVSGGVLGSEPQHAPSADRRFDRHDAVLDILLAPHIDYFSQWLLGAAPTDTDMLELNREREIKKYVCQR